MSKKLTMSLTKQHSNYSDKSPILLFYKGFKLHSKKVTYLNYNLVLAW